MTKISNIALCLFISTVLSIPEASMLTEFFVKIHMDAYSDSEHGGHHHENIADESSPHGHTHKHGDDGEEHQHNHDHFSTKTPEQRFILDLSAKIDPVVVFDVLSGFSVDTLLSNPHPLGLLRPPIS